MAVVSRETPPESGEPSESGVELACLVATGVGFAVDSGGVDVVDGGGGGGGVEVEDGGGGGGGVEVEDGCGGTEVGSRGATDVVVTF